MPELKLRIIGMHCLSCEKILKKELLKLPYIHDVEIKYTDEIAIIKSNEDLSKNVHEVIKVIQQAGYDAMLYKGSMPKEHANFKSYIKQIKQKDNAESKIIRYSIAVLFILTALEYLAYYAFFKDIPNFFNSYGYYLIFLIISVVMISISLLHIKIYGDRFSCMSGMMIGMTSGMISGFLIGMLVAATNGMFIGSVAGILIGIIAGIIAGKCCGVMGVMEGMMAGLMGGLMGAMTTLMMLNDHLRLIIPIVVLISISILTGLDYMIFKEMKDSKPAIPEYSLLLLVTTSFIITIIITFLMILGPKSGLFQ